MFWNRKNYDWVKRVCVIDSAYSLFIYFLISTKEEIDSTFFFWANGIPETVREKFKGHSYTCMLVKSGKSILFYRLFYKLLFSLKFPFLCSSKVIFWGHDHLYFSESVIRKHMIKIIEDGTKNYFKEKIPGTKPYWYYRIVYGPLLFRYEYCFLAPWCEAEYLTGLDMAAPCMHSSKCCYVSVKELWNTSYVDKKKYISYIYDLSLADVEYLKKFDKVLLTQPFDGSETKKIDFYRDKIRKIGDVGLIIKPHPRENTDYVKAFPHIPVFKKKIPLEILTLFGITFKYAYTVNSTSIFDLPSQTERIVWDKEFKVTSF